VELLTKKNYLNTIKKSVGVQIFHNIFAEIDGAEKDITQNGKLSCAFFVSSILMMFHLIDSDKAPHSTIAGTIKNMETNGWVEMNEDKLEDGDIIVWETITDVDGRKHEHIGFYIGNSLAISNSSQKGTPEEHHYTYNGKRAIKSYWHNPSL